ncbi:protoporphyrinogen oxidase [Actinobaculum suis]|uniref:Protoporphyrinogen oxidase n=1 Tax=Actinobaculum suis TaxID=1657 RepID=A0A7Z8Y7A0_9ACTO|nr:FAD-dependent oxidoreductase [Actinobaculum suis]VDG75484.1 protoporphyrinogen oxidase [Actinobaculum suis]
MKTVIVGGGLAGLILARELTHAETAAAPETAALPETTTTLETAAAPESTSTPESSAQHAQHAHHAHHARGTHSAHEVEVFEADAELGGLIHGLELAGRTVEGGAESFAQQDHARAYIESLGLQVQEPRGRSWIVSEHAAFPMPAGSVMGIPAHPESEEVRQVLRDPARAAADATLGPEVGRTANSVGELVEARMGAEVVHTLVAPITTSIYSADPYELAIPAYLQEAFEREGTLAGAVRSIPSGARTASIVGGMYRLPLVLAAQARQAGAVIHTGRKVTAIRAVEGGYELVIETSADAAAPGSAAGSVAAAPSKPHVVHADRVILAAGLDPSAHLLAMISDNPLPEVPRGNPITHVSLALDNPELDNGPRGSGLLTAPGFSRVKGMTHLSYKWRLPAPHVVRLSYNPEAHITEANAAEIATADFTRITGIENPRILDWHFEAWGPALTPRSPQLAQWQDALVFPPGVYGAGSWLAGAGISSIIEHSLGLARQITGVAPAPHPEATSNPAVEETAEETAEPNSTKDAQ